MKIYYPQKDNHFKAEDFGFDEKRVRKNYSVRRSIYAIVINEAGEIASIKYKKEIGKMYLLPGGGVNKGETWEQGLAREIKEEIGCAIKDVRPIGSFDSYDDSTSQWFQSVICTAKPEGEPGKSDPTEDYELGSELIWLTKEELLQKLRELSDPLENPEDCRSHMTLKILSHH